VRLLRQQQDLMVRHHSELRVLDVSATHSSAAESLTHVRAGPRAAMSPMVAGPQAGLAGRPSLRASPEAD
jgi:hypothetical protein